MVPFTNFSSILPYFANWMHIEIYLSTHVSNMIFEAACRIKSNAKVLRWLITWTNILIPSFGRNILRLVRAWSWCYYRLFCLISVECQWIKLNLRPDILNACLKSRNIVISGWRLGGFICLMKLRTVCVYLYEKSECQKGLLVPDPIKSFVRGWK